MPNWSRGWTGTTSVAPMPAWPRALPLSTIGLAAPAHRRTSTRSWRWSSPGATIRLYEPAGIVTRDQMAVYMARSMVDPVGEDGLAGYVPADPRDFPDVPETGYGPDGTEPYWAYKHIKYYVEHGVANGYDDGYYHPDWDVTRDQMTVYIANRQGVRPGDVESQEHRRVQGQGGGGAYVVGSGNRRAQIVVDHWPIGSLRYAREVPQRSAFDLMPG